MNERVSVSPAGGAGLRKSVFVDTNHPTGKCAQETEAEAAAHFAKVRLRRLDEILKEVPKKILGGTEWAVRVGMILFFLALNAYFMGEAVQYHSRAKLIKLLGELDVEELIFFSMPVIEVSIFTYGMYECLRAFFLCPTPQGSAKTVDSSRWCNLARQGRKLRWLGYYSSMMQLAKIKTMPMHVTKQLQILQDHDKLQNPDAPGGLAQLKRIGPHLSKTLLNEFGLIIVGLLALFTKLRSKAVRNVVGTSIFELDTSDILTFLAMANQFAGIVDQEAMGNEVVKKFLFAGEDAVWQAQDHTTRWEVEGAVLREFQVRFGFAYGWLMFSTLAADDWQILVLEESTGSKERRGSEPATKRWAAAAAFAKSASPAKDTKDKAS